MPGAGNVLGAWASCSASATSSVSKTELVIFLRPTVIANPSLDSDELKFFQRFLPQPDSPPQPTRRRSRSSQRDEPADEGLGKGRQGPRTKRARAGAATPLRTAVRPEPAGRRAAPRRPRLRRRAGPRSELAWSRLPLPRNPRRPAARPTGTAVAARSGRACRQRRRRPREQQAQAATVVQAARRRGRAAARSPSSRDVRCWSSASSPALFAIGYGDLRLPAALPSGAVPDASRRPRPTAPPPSARLARRPLPVPGTAPTSVGPAGAAGPGARSRRVPAPRRQRPLRTATRRPPQPSAAAAAGAAPDLAAACRARAAARSGEAGCGSATPPPPPALRATPSRSAAAARAADGEPAPDRRLRGAPARTAATTPQRALRAVAAQPSRATSTRCSGWPRSPRRKAGATRRRAATCRSWSSTRATRSRKAG